MKQNRNKPIVGISIGDVNGIGPEIIIKTLSHKMILNYCIPVIYGAGSVLNYYKKALNAQEFKFNQIKNLSDIKHPAVYVLECWSETVNIQTGVNDAVVGKYAKISLEHVGKDLIEGNIDACVTAPINKENIQNAGFDFPGQTEFFAQLSKSSNCLMMLCSDRIKIATLTGHLALSKVSENVSKDKVKSALKTILKSLKSDFCINKGKVAVLGLNPHVSENGKIGKEDLDSVIPAVEEMKNDGHLIFGPYPSDGFFGSGHYSKFDAILGMYHDQALIPFKMVSFEEGVNFTAGLNVIRTSPDHGTAYDIAGKGVANENSFRAALFQAIDVWRSRHREALES